MAQAILVNDLVLVKAWTVASEQAAVNRVWYQAVSQAGNGGSDADLANVLDPILGPLYKAAIYNTANYRGIQVQIYRNGQPFAWVSQAGAAGVGTNGAIALPRQASGIFSVTTTLAGPAFRGRMYIPFPSTSADVGGGTPTGTYLTQVQAIGTAWLAQRTVGSGGNTTVLNPVIVHKVAAGQPAIVPSFWTNAIGIAKFATQRRRGSYGKANSSPI